VPGEAGSDAVDDLPLRKRKPFVLWGFLLLVFVLVVFPILVGLVESHLSR
jgi:hypothetical protein